MKHKRKVWAIASGALALIIGGVFASKAFAYTVNNDLSEYGYIVKQYGSYTLLGGDSVKVSSTNPGPYPNLSGQTIHIAEEQANVYNGSGIPDGKGNWGLMHADMVGADAQNGYLLIAAPSESTNVKSWVQRLGGNWSYVESYLQTQNQQISTYDNFNHHTYTYDPFATIVTQSGAKFGTATYAPTGGTYQGKPVYLFTYPLYTSAPPSVSGLTVVDSNGQQNVVTQGDQITFQSNVNVPLWSGIAGYHYDAVQIKDNTTGQTQWVVTGNGSYTINGINMEPVQGGHGTFANEQLSPNSSFSTSSLTPGDSYTATEYVADGVHRMCQTPAMVTFSVVPANTQTGGGTTGGITLSANPVQLLTGQSSTLTANVTQGSSSDYIQIVDQSGDNTLSGYNSYSDLQLGETSLTTTAMDNQAQTVTYEAELIDSNTGQIVATSAPVSVNWANPTPTPPPPNGTITLSPSTHQTVSQGTQESISYTTTNWQFGDHVQIVPNATNASDTWSNNNDQASADTLVEAEYPQNGQTAQVSYTAYLYNSSGQVISVSQSGMLIWTSSAPTIQFTASPTKLPSGQASQLSYTISNLGASDYVTVAGSGGKNMWSVTKSTSATGSYSEVENPINGASTTVNYTATVYDQAGESLSQSKVTITWTSQVPTISMSANPQTMVPGQPSTISYQTQSLGKGDYVDVVGTGGADAWNAQNLTGPAGYDSETENPSAGQTIAVNYTATIYSPSGQAIAHASATAKWVNAWSGTIQLSANPLFLADGNPTTLQATTSAAVPSGYTLYIKDLSTGQTIAKSGTSPESTTYTSYSPETDQFEAYMWDGYEQVGTTSNTVSVVWSALSLNANPTQLPINDATTLTVSGQNVPSGYYLIIADQSTGQIVGYSQSTPYSMTQTQSSAQTDTYIAYINSSATVSGAYATSNTVPVDWYSVTLTANPTRLPVSHTSTLTANAQNMPSGYVLDIVDQTSNRVVASGRPGQTMVQVLQTRNQVETDSYISQVVHPSNPPIPGMTVPPSTPPDGLFSVTSTEVQHYDPSTNTFGNIAGLPITVGSTVTNGWITGTVGQAQFDYGVYDPYNQTVYATEFYSITDTNYWPPETYENYEVFGYNLNTDSWTPVQYIEQNYLPGFYETEYFPDQMFYNPKDHDIYVLYSRIDMYGDYTFQLDVINPSTTTLSTPITQSGMYTYSWYDPSAAHGNGRWIEEQYWPYDSVNLDPATGNLYYTGFQWSYGYYQYGGILPEYLMEYVDSTGQAKVFPAQMDHSGIMGVGAAYDPSNGLIYFAGWYETQYAPFYTYDRLYSFNPTTNTTTDLGPMPNYNANDPLPNVNYINGHILVTNGSIYEYRPSSNTYTPAPFETAVVDSQLNQYAVPGATFYDSNFVWAKYASNGGGQLSYGLSSKGPTLNIKYFPYWTFQQDMPSYVPSSLFPHQAVASGSGFWTESGNVPNGTAFFETNFDLPTAQTVTISNPLGNADGYEVVYIDGVPVLQNGNSAGTIPSQSGATTGTSISLSLPAGLHQVVIEGVNTNGFSSPSPNSAAVGLQIVSQSGQTLVSDAASSWMTTGYVQQLPAGWFSGAVGDYTFTEYVLQENPSQVIYQQQTFTVQSTPSAVTAQSSPVAVTWFNPVIPPDNFTLQALPTDVTYPGQTLFKTTFDQSDVNFVNQEFGGTAKVVVRAVQTWQPVATGTWTPNSNGTWISMPYAPVGGTTLQYVAELVDPSKGGPVAMSNQVTVTDTGNGVAGSSYTTTECSAQGNGTEIFNTYTNGKLTSTKTVPLTMQNLEVDGIFNATATLKSDLGGVVKLPVLNSQLGYGVPIPLRVQAPFAFAMQFPDAQPTKVTATFTVNEGDAVDMNGDTSWTVKMHPATNLPYGFWQGETIMPKLPDGDHISVSITATDDCGSNTTPTDVFPYDDFLTTNGRPQWYFVQPSKP